VSPQSLSRVKTEQYLDAILRRSDLKLMQTQMAAGAPAALQITRTELGLRLSSADADQPIGKQLLQCHLAALPPLTLAERLYVINCALSRRCIRSRLRLNYKRRVLRVLAAARHIFMLIDVDHRRYLLPLLRSLSSLLHEPDAQITQLVREHMFYYDYNYCRRRVHAFDMKERKRCLQEFDWPEEENYRDYTQQHPGSRVLMTIHMGDFIGAFNRIAGSIGAQSPSAERRTLSLMREQTAEDGDSPHASNHASHRIMAHGRYNPMEIVSALRQGDTTLCVLFDLRADFGETVIVDFFGKRSALVKGPAMLAILGRATIFPFVTFEHDGSWRIEMGVPLEPGLKPGESLEDATIRIVQRMASLAERWIRRSPAQWKYLLSLCSYFVAERPATDKHSHGERAHD
jgi:predicted LPLAT superfamily acyltransferase